jgi:hypothetical protein
MIILNDLLYDLQTAKGIALLFFTSQSAKDLHKVIIVLLKAKNGEITLCYLA